MPTIDSAFIRVSYMGGGGGTIRLGAGVSSSDVSFRLVPSRSELVLEIAGTSDKISIVDPYRYADSTNYFGPIEHVEFADGTTWDLAELRSRVTRIEGTPSADTLSGASYSETLVGYAGNDSISGMDGDDLLDGGAGADNLKGGTGNDVYVVDATTDSIQEFANEGSDAVRSSVTWTLGSNLENLTLTGTAPINGTGNTLANVIVGNAGNNSLNGGAGDDTVLGGAGDDTYTVDSGGDVVSENASEGTDLVQSAISYALGANLEKLTLTGSAGNNATGNTLANTLVGNSGTNRLDGGTGADSMNGGTGNDTYVVDDAGDVVTEATSAGTDTIESSLTWTLGSNLENLTLTGIAAINASGNTLNNTLVGNSAANVLTGAAGDDTYDGGAGNDTFTDTSTTSNDTYRWGIGSGLDTLTDAGGSLDHVDLNAGIAKSQLKFVKSANDLQLSVIGQTDKLTIKNWYVGSANKIEEFRLSDGSKVMASEVQGLLSAMAAFVPMDSVITPAKTGFIDLPLTNPLVPPQAWM